LTALLNLDAPYNHGQPEERIQVSVSDSYHTTVTDIGPDGRPIIRKSILGVAAVAKIGVMKVRVDDTLRLTGVRSTSGVGQIATHVAAVYGHASYGLGGYNTPDSGRSSKTTFEIGSSAIGGTDSIGEPSTAFTIGPSKIGGPEKLS